MKKYIILSLGLLFFCFSSPKPYKKAKKQNWMYVKDSLLMSAYEMSNGEYNAYLKDLKSQNQIAAYQLALPDTTVWVNDPKLQNNEPFMLFYFQYPAYSDYPLVGVTQQQAIDYCKWLTNKTNNDPKRVFKKVLIRLPTKAEWRYAARASDSDKIYPWKGLYVRNSKGIFLANFRVIGEENLIQDSFGKITGDRVYRSKFIKKSNNNDTIYEEFTVFESEYQNFITTQVESYFPNELGLYNMAGNVSELVAEKNQYIGGDWFSIAQFLRINNPTRTLEKPIATVGFRYVIEVLEF